MSNNRGCLKNGCFGCLGLLAIGVLIVGISALMAWRGLDDKDLADLDRTRDLSSTGSAVNDGPGRVVLELSEGDFEIVRGQPGEGVRVEARFDREVHELTDSLVVDPESGWVYTVRFRRTMPVLEAMFRAIMGGGEETHVKVYLPPDVPLALDVKASRGGLTGDLGGLWLTAADVSFKQGGFELDVSRPLREPMESMRLSTAMGGFELENLGNASPRVLDVNCQMGGAEVDLDGDWSRDCDARVRMRMGGMVLAVPENIRVERVSDGDRRLVGERPEVPLPTMRLSASVKMGELEVIDRGR
jgi:hypothetical protein